MNEETEEELEKVQGEVHPSYGVAVVTRATGGPGHMFMSGLSHQHRVCLSIRRAAKMRDQGFAHTFPREEIVRVEFTELQWGQLLSRMSLGTGTPCTLARVSGKTVPDCPPDTTFKDVENHAKTVAERAVAAVPKLRASIRKHVEVLRSKPSLSKTQVLGIFDEILGSLSSLETQIASNLPSVTDAIQEHAEALVEDAQMLIYRYAENAAQMSGAAPVRVSVTGAQQLALPAESEET